jgi:multidrug resistance efflux pump
MASQKHRRENAEFTDSRPDERLLWAQFRRASTNTAFFRSWLAVQCAAIEEIEFGLVLWRGSTGGSLVPVATWPPGGSPGPHLIEAAEKVLEERRAAAIEVSRSSGDGAGGAPTGTVLAQPIEVGRSVVGAVLLEIAPRARAEVERELRALVWGSGWLMQRAERSRSGGSKGTGFEALLDLVAVPHEHERFTAAATAFASELATRFQCSQVSLGFVEGGRVRVCAVSHAARFSAKTNVNRAREAAMEEALDQQADVLWPTPPDAAPQVVRAHQELARLTDAGALGSILFSHGPSFSGVAIFERGPGDPFHAGEVELLQAAAGLTGPLLGLQRREDRWIGRKALESARRTLARLVGPGHVALKLTCAAAALLVLFLILAKGDYRVTADSVLEARVLRAAVAPFDGYLVEAPARAGDRVRKGDPLAVLDDRELLLEETRHASQLEQLANQHRQAIAERNAANVRILAAQIGQVEAQLSITRDRLAKTRVVAPFDGVVVTGDLSQALGTPLQRGDLLFEVAPLDDYRLVLQVDERDIDELAVGLTGNIAFAASPDEGIPFTVEKLMPVSTPGEGKNTFRVEAQLAELPERLQPGMEGVAKVGVDRRRLIWIWTHRGVDWLRLTLWSWLP